MKIVGTTALKIVPMTSAVGFRPAASMMDVLTKMMYAIVTKVVNPAMNSVRCELPTRSGCKTSAKKPGLAGGGVVAGVSPAGTVSVVAMSGAPPFAVKRVYTDRDENT